MSEWPNYKRLRIDSLIHMSDEAAPPLAPPCIYDLMDSAWDCLDQCRDRGLAETKMIEIAITERNSSWLQKLIARVEAKIRKHDAASVCAKCTTKCKCKRAECTTKIFPKNDVAMFENFQTTNFLKRQLTEIVDHLLFFARAVCIYFWRCARTSFCLDGFPPLLWEALSYSERRIYLGSGSKNPMYAWARLHWAPSCLEPSFHSVVVQGYFRLNHLSTGSTEVSNGTRAI
jgi:hypothetical protein